MQVVPCVCGELARGMEYRGYAGGKNLIHRKREKGQEEDEGGIQRFVCSRGRRKAENMKHSHGLLEKERSVEKGLVQ